jgi:hypothetical protein
MVALNLGIINNIEEWDGRNDIETEELLVTHKSLPHFHRSMPNRWLDISEVLQYDKIILVTRDINCARISSIRDHQPNKILAKQEAERGIEIMKDILTSRPDSFIFSYETAQILQESYTIPFMKKLGIQNPNHVEFKNVNQKYIGGI